jgi:PAS domain S-box-containing protein
LLENEIKFGRFLELMPGYCFYLDTQLHFCFGNTAFLKVFGESLPKLTGKHIDEIMAVSLFGNNSECLDKMNRGQRSAFESIISTSDKTLNLSVEAVPDTDSSGKTLGFYIFAQDIGERKLAEAEKEKSEARFLLLFNSMDEGVAINEAIQDEHGNVVDYIILEVNAAFEKHSPYALKEAQGKRATALYHMSSEFITEWWNQHATPSDRWFSITTTPRDGKRFVTIFTDITKKKTDEALLQESALRLEQLAEFSGTIVWEVDAQGIFTFVSQVSKPILGFTPKDLIGQKSFFDLLHSSEREASKTEIMGTFLKKEPIRNLVKPMETQDGNQVWLLTNALPLTHSDGTLKGYRGSLTDITMRKKMEASLRNSQNLESLGILAGSIAHDFNNLLSGIFGYVDLASALTQEKNVREYLTEVQNSIERARALTHQFLTFAKGGAPIVKLEPITPFLIETTQFALSSSDITAKFFLPEELWAGSFDRNQMSQVIDNIIVNAVDAMPAGGNIEVSAKNVSLSKSEHPDLTEGNYLRITLKDEGAGIPQENLYRIFDPFFTTKKHGHGLGLATCYSIVKRHGGTITAESIPSNGSTFHIYLPADRSKPTPQPKIIFRSHSGTGTILIMDDEKVVRDTLGEMLESMGYTVILTNTGTEAVNQVLEAQKAQQAFACIILDLTVQNGLGGRETAMKIRELGNHAPLIVSSGYADDTVLAYPSQFGFKASLRKPFRKSELEEILNQTLGT